MQCSPTQTHLHHMTEEELTNAEYFASLLLNDVELAQVLEVETERVTYAVRALDSELGKAIRKGRLKTKCELRESVLTTARRHSTPAQQMALDMLMKLELQ